MHKIIRALTARSVTKKLIEVGDSILTHFRDKAEAKRVKLEAFMQSEANSVAAGEQPTTLWDRIKEFFGIEPEIHPEIKYKILEQHAKGIEASYKDFSIEDDDKLSKSANITEKIIKFSKKYEKFAKKYPDLAQHLIPVINVATKTVLGSMVGFVTPFPGRALAGGLTGLAVKRYSSYYSDYMQECLNDVLKESESITVLVENKLGISVLLPLKLYKMMF